MDIGKLIVKQSTKSLLNHGGDSHCDLYYADLGHIPNLKLGRGTIN